jgi:hypothetical protein
MDRLMINYRRHCKIREVLNEYMSRDLADETAQRLIGLIDHPGR